MKGGSQMNPFVYDIGDEVGNIIITNKLRTGTHNSKTYEYECRCCGTNDFVTENNLLKYLKINPLSKICGVCANKKVKSGYNDIPTTAPWMVDYFKGGYEEAKNYTKSSNKKVKFVCPHCKREKSKAIPIRRLYDTHSIGCTCGDGISYPEKIMISCLEQLGLNYEYEYSPDWIKPKRYDFYIPSKNLIVEMDGNLGHGHKNKMGKRTQIESLEIDKYKDELALKNGITVIRIDSRKSDISFIKNNIIHSNVFSHQDLNVIDFMVCEEFALSNKCKEVCDYYEKHKPISSIKLAEIFKVAHSTIQNYLSKGNKIGWCDYNGKSYKVLAGMKSGRAKGKPIVVFLNGEKVKEYPSASELERNSEKDFGVKLLATSVSAVARGEHKHHKGYTFSYKNTDA